jgi:hypothetical protein
MPPRKLELMGRETESHQGTYGVVAFSEKIAPKKFFSAEKEIHEMSSWLKYMCAGWWVAGSIDV